MNLSFFIAAVLLIFMYLNTVSDAVSKCTPSGIYNDQFKKCYHVIRSPLNSAVSSVTCEDIGGRLVAIHNAFEQALIFGTVKKESAVEQSDYWIGLSYNKDLDEWDWSDMIFSEYTHWQQGSPEENFVAKPCVAVNVTSGYWYNRNCTSETKHFVCELDVPTGDQSQGCAGNGTYFVDRCLYSMRSVFDRDDASAMCGHFDGTLVNINNEQKQAVVERLKANSKENYWIGLFEGCNGDHPWIWDDGTDCELFDNWDSPAFPMWETGQPCVAALRNDGQWFNTICEEAEEFSFVCELPALNSTSSIQVSAESEDDDNDGWHYFEESDSLYLVTEWTRNFTSQEYYCASRNGHLASIHSVNENDFVKNITDDLLWIGLRLMNGDTLKWTDNTAVDYIAPGLTAGTDANSRDDSVDVCVYARFDGHWVKENCALPLRAACKKQRIQCRMIST